MDDNTALAVGSNADGFSFQYATTPDVPPQGHVLDRAIWHSLNGAHARFAVRNGRALRYNPEVAPFVVLEDPSDERSWDDAAELVGRGGRITLYGVTAAPEGWQIVFQEVGVQLVETALESAPDPEADVLGADDVPEILDLIGRTRPGPFEKRTIELGTYLGIRRDGKLVAMAGERMHPPGWTEISAVCTDDAYRGQGLGTRLVRAVAAGIRQRGERSFLHALASNTNAIRLYESIGFTERMRGPLVSFEKL